MAKSGITETQAEASAGGSHHWLRLLIFLGLAVGLAAAGRRWAMSKTDTEFEERLRAADERRD